MSPPTESLDKTGSRNILFFYPPPQEFSSGDAVASNPGVQSLILLLLARLFLGGGGDWAFAVEAGQPRFRDCLLSRARILVQVTICRRILIGRDGHLDQSEAYDVS